VNVTYDPTALTSLTASANRSIADSALIGVPGVLQTTYTLQVRHELLRSLIITLDTQYNRENYRGIDRRQNRIAAGISITKFINRYLTASIRYDYQTSNSSGEVRGISYKENRIGASLILSK